MSEGMNVMEMNFVRLLQCTEDLATEGRSREWRFSNYLSALENFYTELASSASPPPADYMRHYESRLKQLILTRKLALTEGSQQRESLLISPSIPLVSLPDSNPRLKLGTQDNVLISLDTKVMADKSQSSEFAVTARKPLVIEGSLDRDPEIYRREQGKTECTQREELLATDRSQNKDNNGPTQNSRPYLLNREELRREELATEMLGMAKHLKDQSTAISDRLQSDRGVVEATISQADRIRTDLAKAMQQLSEELGSRCARTVWCALLIALLVFVHMVGFMKLFRKRTRASSLPPSDEL
ncbi:unnamed protein product [Calicophoron daubneyi]|uniref:Vesicle transport protein USE1 n=1 Tax=Calicophoron daubneyi TaxID=300641 RepID=A0AAV2SYJ2_CALDB